jgi:hypothetical protein
MLQGGGKKPLEEKCIDVDVKYIVKAVVILKLRE